MLPFTSRSSSYVCLKVHGSIALTDGPQFNAVTETKGFIAFTTTNPDNRYIRLKDIKTNHNLRDFYYRDIVLGEQDEPVYEPTNSYEIALAFREAGEDRGA